ncbi:protein of unknown function [Formosa sp. Hel1_31_208]|uniref:DUF4174 domain-containing protein n=1 Tax=Formosa sp. Hel1_31_208 TaxID=1798225 RepID=UPI0008794079|nr:DUF4174 domain-containing protein [Formosa sp. Hel1_31_208]SDR66602.1 protein of unknown function [Formosa sp. Hel1_31_208]
MKFRTLIGFSILVLLTNLINAQDLSKHQWNNRVLLIITEDTGNTVFQNQINSLNNQDQALKERKLLVYQISPTHYKIGISEHHTWTVSQKLYRQFKTEKTSFVVLLIGLDGSVKQKQDHILNPKTLFNIIDGMPMRLSEIRGNK